MTHKYKTMIGIYKITSPSGRIYIGQSNNIEKRFKAYEKLYNKQQIRLYNSFINYGFENHIFEIIEECDEINLNIYERKWQDYYDVLNQEKGLNCRLTATDNKSGIISDDTKLKMSLKKINRILSEETKLKMSNSHKERYKTIPHHAKGKKHSDELKLKMSEASPKASSIKVINIETNEIFNSIKEAALSTTLSYNTLLLKLKGIRKNETNLKYYEENNTI